MDESYLVLGPLIISKSFLSLLLPVFTTLMGTIVGGVLGYQTSSRIEERRYRRVVRERTSSRQREALEAALALTGKFVHSLGMAASIADMHLKGWAPSPSLYDNLVKPEYQPAVPESLRPFMPAEAEALESTIVRAFSTLLLQLGSLHDPTQSVKAAHKILALKDETFGEIGTLHAAASAELRRRYARGD